MKIRVNFNKSNFLLAVYVKIEGHLAEMELKHLCDVFFAIDLEMCTLYALQAILIVPKAIIYSFRYE